MKDEFPEDGPLTGVQRVRPGPVQDTLPDAAAGPDAPLPQMVEQYDGPTDLRLNDLEQQQSAVPQQDSEAPLPEMVPEAGELVQFALETRDNGGTWEWRCTCRNPTDELAGYAGLIYMPSGEELWIAETAWAAISTDGDVWLKIELTTDHINGQTVTIEKPGTVLACDLTANPVVLVRNLGTVYAAGGRRQRWKGPWDLTAIFLPPVYLAFDDDVAQRLTHGAGNGTPVWIDPEPPEIPE